jgi:hypothetical protein
VATEPPHHGLGGCFAHGGGGDLMPRLAVLRKRGLRWRADRGDDSAPGVVTVCRSRCVGSPAVHAPP